MLKFMAHPTRKLKISKFPFHVWFMTRELMCIIIITSKSSKSLHIFVDLHQWSATLYNPSFLCTLFQRDFVIVGRTSIRLSNNPIATWEESLLGIFFLRKKRGKIANYTLWCHFWQDHWQLTSFSLHVWNTCDEHVTSLFYWIAEFQIHSRFWICQLKSVNQLDWTDFVWHVSNY